MHIKKFPTKMWRNLSAQTSPPLQTIWKKEVICGALDSKYEGAKLTGCNAELILSRKDFYKKVQDVPGGQNISIWWLCPCCAMENPIPVQEIDINSKIASKSEWLIERRDSIVNELLMDKQFNKGITGNSAEEFLNELEISLPESYVQKKEQETPIVINRPPVSE